MADIQCTLDTCPLEESIYQYRPSLAANITFLAVFALSGLAHLLQGIFLLRKPSFTVPILLGCVTEIIGYVGRIMLYYNPFSDDGFLMQICCLTLGPAFFAAAIYFCMGDVVRLFGGEDEDNDEDALSRIKPRYYPFIFIPCDVVSLVLQGTGGGLASVAAQTDQDSTPGTNVMVAGLAFQVFSLLVFISLVCDLVWRARRRRRMRAQQGGHLVQLAPMSSPPTTSAEESHDDLASASAPEPKPKPGAKPTQSLSLPYSNARLALFAIPFSAAVLLIFTRCVYRVAELSDGWSGPLISHEPAFIALECVYVITSSSLNLLTRLRLVFCVLCTDL